MDDVTGEDPGRLRDLERTQALHKAERLVASIDRPAEAVAALAGYWHHTFELADGIVIRGGKTFAALAVEYEMAFGPLDLAGRSVLDIGAWNGRSHSKPSGEARRGCSPWTNTSGCMPA